MSKSTPRPRSYWNRVTEAEPCPVCDKPDWCSVRDDQSAVCCARTKSQTSLGEAGWLHVLKPSQWRHRRRKTIKMVARGYFDAEHKNYTDRITDDQVDWLANDLGVSAQSLRAFEVGWRDERPRGFTFPVRYANSEIAGIQIRTMDNFKCTVKGSVTKGVFYPAHVDTRKAVFVTEGVSDACALSTLGFEAIARFNKTTPHFLVTGAVRNYGIRRLVIVADIDADGGGERAARELADYCRKYGVRTNLLIPPCKDVRAWLATGVTIEEVAKEVV